MFAAVTCYFNPYGFANRAATVAPFVASILPQLKVVGAKLYGVELLWNGDNSVLRSAGVENVIEIRNPNAARIFQKEALLNIGIQQAIQDGFEFVGWFDVDCVFAQPTWAREALRTLQRFDVIQPARVIQSDYDEGEQRARLSAARAKKIGKVHTGGAWLVTRKFYEAIGQLYPHAILGGADWCIWGAIYNRLRGSDQAMVRDSKRYRPNILSNREFLADWQAWAARVPATVKVGHSPGKISLLNHGPRKTRKYGGRHKLYKSFNPQRDLINVGGVFEWSPEANREFVQIAAEYMEGRKC